jgi:hypothetical protein
MNSASVVDEVQPVSAATRPSLLNMVGLWSSDDFCQIGYQSLQIISEPPRFTSKREYPFFDVNTFTL